MAHRTNPAVAKIDRNANGYVDMDELDAFNKSLSAMVDEEMAAFFARNDGPVDAPIDSVPLESALAILDQKPVVPKSAEEIAEQELLAEYEAKQTYSEDVKWYLRKKGSDVSIRADRFDGNAATISFSNDGVEGVSNGRITAALGLLREVRIKRDKAPAEGPYVSAITYGGAVSIDQAFDSRGSSFEKFNSLQLRAGGELEIANLFFPVQYVSGWTYLDTDTDFGKRIVGGEIAYEPFHADFLRGFSVAGGRIIARVAPELRASYEGVISDPDNAYPYEDALLTGYGITAGISYITDRKIASFTSRFADSWNVIGENERVYHWANSLDWFLNKEENFTLTASHDYELNDLTSEQINAFELGTRRTLLSLSDEQAEEGSPGKVIRR